MERRILVQDAPVERITVTVRRSVDSGTGWMTVEVQAEAATDPACWNAQALRLSEQLECLVEERLEAQRVRYRSPGGDGRNRAYWVDQFWRAVYGAGLSNKAGHALLDRARGDFRAALRLFRRQQASET